VTAITYVPSATRTSGDPMHLTIGVGNERVTVADDTGTLVITCTCGVPDCPHVVAVEIGDRAAVSPKEVGELVTAGALIERHGVDMTVRLAERLMRIARDPARKEEIAALKNAIIGRLQE
jgi:hypothetical protein